MPANTDFNPVVVSPYHDEPAAMTGQELMAANPYRPWPARITSITELTATEKLFEFRLIDERIREAFRHEPGQFVELTIFGVGEAPISISSSPSKRGFIELCVRRAGRFTEALHKMQCGDIVGIREMCIRDRYYKVQGVQTETKTLEFPKGFDVQGLYSLLSELAYENVRRINA